MEIPSGRRPPNPASNSEGEGAGMWLRCDLKGGGMVGAEEVMTFKYLLDNLTK